MQITKKPVFNIALLIIITGVIAYFVNVYFRPGATGPMIGGEQEAAKEDTIESLLRQLELEVINLNSSLPKIIDEDTRVDNISIEPGPRLLTKYTYTNFSTDEFDSELFDKKVSNIIKKSICNNDEILGRMNLGLIYSYEFSGNDGVKLATAEFDVNDC